MDILNWMAIGLLLALLGLIGFIFIEMQRRTYGKAVVGKLLCEVVTKTGAVRKALCSYDGQQVFIPKEGEKPKKTRLITGKVDAHTGCNVYLVDDTAVFRTRYPEAGIMSLLGTTIGKVYYREGSIEPQIRHEPTGDVKEAPNMTQERFGTSNPLGTPELLGHLRDEKFTALAIEFSSALEDFIEKMGKPFQALVLYIGFGLLVIIGGITLYMLFQLANDTGLLKIAAGVG